MSSCTVIKSDAEKHRLLDEMIAFSGSQQYATASDWSNLFIGLTINLPAEWSIYKVDIDYKDENKLLDQYLLNHDPWRHHGHATQGHNETGMIFAEWSEMTGRLQNVGLGDSPDFSAMCGDNMVFGDIGDCTPLAFLNGIRGLSIHDLWISVLSLNYQVIIEFNYSVGSFVSRITGNYGGIRSTNQSIEENVKDMFYCNKHDTWTITRKSLDKVYKYFGHTGEKIGIPLQMAMQI